ncbi:Lysophospholipase, alpha-beta hydrolase superfamily [Mycobacterium numidiamassiliense]|uniref:Lysophospholipase, alpha-beta hydrolase superfamily n=1 Tax=Mycobacterium numidiamassiliense TaxID=1841861 RepID=A0A2U3PG57_9MYCO|nr:alpha/beta fold hydrolase [Mycobacterium numidiamassiliense]SPM42764.1 Lysophospholipase, alpha-beta hydrolase superfamily [Mycobacterium numidiamassiliense]
MTISDQEIIGRFRVGYYELHPNVSLNFQLNRFYGWANDGQMLDEIRAAVPRISNYPDWTREMLELSDNALAAGRPLPAAYYARGAQFFLDPDDPRYEPALQRFLDNVLAGNGVTPDDHHLVPYQGTHLSAYRFTPAQPRGTIVVFGGFDSYIVEWLPAAIALRDAGLDTVIFDGPGQGTVLDAGTPMTPDWHLPVAAVLDYFGLNDVTLMGFSLGGCLVLRAAARERRVSRVIAFDIMTELFECITRSPAGLALGSIGANADRIPAPVIDAAFEAIGKVDLLTEWGFKQAKRVMGVATPSEALTVWQEYRTDDVAPLVTQPVLLMAGTKDHYVPLHQLGDQVLTLTAAPSVSARVFTEAEQAQNHCQIGNTGLAIKVILDWVDATGGRAAPDGDER